MKSRVRVEAAKAPIGAAMAFAVVALFGLGLPGAAVGQIRGNAQADQSRALGTRSVQGLPPSGRYLSDSGEAFIFDGSSSRPLFRFEQRTETWVLRPTPAPRGDVIYRNDAGSQILRVTPDGGVTLYTTRAPNGSPAAVVGAGERLQLPQITPTQLVTYSIQQSGRMSAALGHLVAVNIELDPPQPGRARLEPAVAETISVVAEAVLRMSRSATVRDRVAQLRNIQIEQSSRPGASFRNGTLLILIAGDQGVTGRPSSARIIQAVSGG